MACVICAMRADCSCCVEQARPWAQMETSACSAAYQVGHQAVSHLPASIARCCNCPVVNAAAADGLAFLRSPGIGEFQCYDQYMMDSLRAAAKAAGHPDWCVPPLFHSLAG